MTDFLFDVDLSIEAPKPPEPPPASAEYLVAGGDSSEIIVYSIGGDTLDEVSRLSVAPRNRVLGLQFSPDGNTLWIAARASSGNVLYLASAKFSAGVLSEYTEHQTIGTQFQQHVSMSVSGSRLAVLGMDNARLRLFDVSGNPSEIANIATGGDPRSVTFCGASDQYIAYTTGNGNTLELVDATDLTALDSYAGRGNKVAAHRGTDVIFATGGFSDLDALSVSGGTISMLSAGPGTGSGSLVWLPNRGELWSGEVFAPWDGSAWGANVQTAIGANKIIAAGPSEQRIAAVWPTTNPPGIVLYRTDDPETVADSLSEAESLAGRALAITGGGGASALTKAELAPPIIDDISPTEGPASGGTLVGIRGARFRDGARVFFGDTESTSVTLISQIKINAVTPAEDEGPADVTVINPDGQEANLANGFEFTAPVTTLTVTGIDPSTGPEAGGTAVTITGTGFVTGATVTIGGNAATSVVVVNSTTITCDTPAGSAGNADVVVTNPDTESATLVNGFEYTAGGSEWTPADITTLLWLDADDASTLTIAGSDVTEWRDKSGNGYDANSNAQYVASGINGKPNVEISATAGSDLDFPTAVPIPAGSFFAAYVFRWKSDTGNNLGLWRGPGSSGGNFHIIKTPSGLPWMRRDGSNVLNPSTGRAFVIDEDVQSGWGFESGVEASVWMDGVKEHSATTSVTGTGFNLTDFGWQNSIFERFHAYFGEIIFLAYMPSTTEREKIEGYLAHKWGLTGALPVGHPYKDDPP